MNRDKVEVDMKKFTLDNTNFFPLGGDNRKPEIVCLCRKYGNCRSVNQEIIDECGNFIILDINIQDYRMTGSRRKRRNCQNHVTADRTNPRYIYI
jgi:hypothetical protein